MYWSGHNKTRPANGMDDQRARSSHHGINIHIPQNQWDAAYVNADVDGVPVVRRVECELAKVASPQPVSTIRQRTGMFDVPVS